MALLIAQLKIWQETRWERGSDTQQMVHRPGVKAGSTAARTQPLYMGRWSTNWAESGDVMQSAESDHKVFTSPDASDLSVRK